MYIPDSIETLSYDYQCTIYPRAKVLPLIMWMTCTKPCSLIELLTRSIRFARRSQLAV